MIWRGYVCVLFLIHLLQNRMLDRLYLFSCLELKSIMATWSTLLYMDYTSSVYANILAPAYIMYREESWVTNNCHRWVTRCYVRCIEIKFVWFTFNFFFLILTSFLKIMLARIDFGAQKMGSFLLNWNESSTKLHNLLRDPNFLSKNDMFLTTPWQFHFFFPAKNLPHLFLILVFWLDKNLSTIYQ